MAEPASVDPLDTLLDPLNTATALVPTRSRTMAAIEPTTNPIATEPDTPVVASSAAASTQAPSSAAASELYC
jgi:hypothetical protein